MIKLHGTIRQSEQGAPPRTAGRFNKLIEENRPVFRRYFGVDLFAGSLNVDVPVPTTLQKDMDQGKYRPAFVIPRAELVGMPPYIGDGQAWRCEIVTEKLAHPIDCWVFRRIGSRVPSGVIEVLSTEQLTKKYALVHGDPVQLSF